MIYFKDLVIEIMSGGYWAITKIVDIDEDNDELLQAWITKDEVREFVKTYK
jgi:hypothetical protein